jgi:hypothetical protein
VWVRPGFENRPTTPSFIVGGLAKAAITAEGTSQRRASKDFDFAVASTLSSRDPPDLQVKARRMQTPPPVEQPATCAIRVTVVASKSQESAETTMADVSGISGGSSATTKLGDWRPFKLRSVSPSMFGPRNLTRFSEV